MSSNNIVTINKYLARQQYRGYSITMNPEFESTELRLDRGHRRSKIIGYRYTIRPEYNVIESEEFRDYETAFNDACERIDALLETL